MILNYKQREKEERKGGMARGDWRKKEGEERVGMRKDGKM
jgi:hypothetical protein